MVVSRAGERRPGTWTLGVPRGPLSRRDAEKAHKKQAREVVDALEYADIVNKQSGGRLRTKWKLVLAGLEARRLGFRNVPAMQTALARDEPACTVSEWLRARDCDLGSNLGPLHRLLHRLNRLYLLHVHSLLELAGDWLVVGVLTERIPEGDKRAAQVAFAVQLSKVCKVTRAQVIDWLREPGQQQDLDLSLIHI